MSMNGVEEMTEAVLAECERTDQERHRCEVRFLIGIRHEFGSWDPHVGYLDTVEKKRGKESRDRLAGDVRDQWKKGNRGAQGDWK